LFNILKNIVLINLTVIIIVHKQLYQEFKALLIH
jgi:hypothetical protein